MSHRHTRMSAALVGAVLTLAGTAGAQTPAPTPNGGPRQVDVGLGYLRQSCMNGAQAQVVTPWAGRRALVGEFAATFGPDCGSSRPEYRDLLLQGGVRWSWSAGARTRVYAQTLAGVLHSTAGAYEWSYTSNGVRVPVREPELTIGYFALTLGAGLTTVLTPRYGVYAQIDSLTGIADQSQWEGSAGFGRASAGVLVAAGRPFSTDAAPSSRPRRTSTTPDGAVTREHWDAGLLAGVTADADFEDQAAAVYAATAGYYLTPHLKLDGRVMWPHRLQGDEYEDIDVPGLPGGGYQFTDVEVERQSTALGVSWQFGENVRVHPYLSAGVRIDRERWHRFRLAQQQVGSYGPYPGVVVRYTVPALDVRSRGTEARPYAGGGAKVYLGSRVFTRGEWLWSSTGNLLAGGGGVDF